MADRRELRINLAELAESYGIDILEEARVLSGVVLVLVGQKEG